MSGDGETHGAPRGDGTVGGRALRNDGVLRQWARRIHRRLADDQSEPTPDDYAAARDELTNEGEGDPSNAQLDALAYMLAAERVRRWNDDARQAEADSINDDRDEGL